MKTFTFFMLLSIVSISSFGQSSLSKQEIRDQLMDKFLENYRPTFTVREGKHRKILILKSKFCNENNCERLFPNHANKIKFVTREYLFQRGISNWIEIISIDYTNESIKLREKTKDYYKILIYEL